MTKSIKELIIDALNTYRGDDLERARAAFRGCSEIELDHQYGESGKTRRKILQEYADEYLLIDKAIQEVNERL